MFGMLRTDQRVDGDYEVNGNPVERVYWSAHTERGKVMVEVAAIGYDGIGTLARMQTPWPMGGAAPEFYTYQDYCPVEPQWVTSAIHALREVSA